MKKSKSKIKYVTLLLTALLLLTSCQSLSSNSLPDVKEYTKSQQQQAVEEINSGYCPIIGDVFMGDYYIMREQVRAME